MFAPQLAGQDFALDTQFFDPPPAIVSYLPTERIEMGVMSPELRLAELSVREKLSALAHEIHDPAARQKFSNPKLPLRELLRVVAYVTPKQRVSIVISLLGQENSSADVRNFVDDKIDNILSYMSVDEQVLVVKELFANGPKLNDEKISQVLRSSESLEEAGVIISSQSTSDLDRAGPLTRELVAKVQLVTFLRSHEFNLLNNQNQQTSLCDLATRFEGLLLDVVSHCKNDPRWCNSQEGKDMLMIAQETLKNFKADSDQAGSDGVALFSCLNYYGKLCDIQFRYGVHISAGKSDSLDKRNLEEERIDALFSWSTNILPNPALTEVKWTEKDLDEISNVLSEMPEGALLFTPMLRDIELVPSLGWGVLGARFGADGRIKIAAWTIGNESFAQNYEGVSALKIVLAHEIGHGIQIGAGPSDIQYPNKSAPYFEGGEKIYDFDEYLAISGWEVISRDRYIEGDEPGTLVVDGNVIRPEETVQIDGHPYVFHFMERWNVLFCYRADGEFSHRDYAKASPWEDFAEAFAEYIYLPERLLKEAPHKFLHLEEEFGKYRNNSGIQRLLGEAGF